MKHGPEMRIRFPRGPENAPRATGAAALGSQVRTRIQRIMSSTMTGGRHALHALEAYRAENPQDTPNAGDKGIVSLFLDNANNIFETASKAPGAPADMSILIDSSGGIQMVADSDWPLDSLCRERGAVMGYRVTSRGGSVKLEGRSGLHTCVIESPHPARTAMHLLGSRPHYSAPQTFTPPLPARTLLLLPAA